MNTQTQVENTTNTNLFTPSPALCPYHYEPQMLCCFFYYRYWPYLKKMAEKLPELQPLVDMKPFLSVMHAKAHTGKCEVQRQVKCLYHNTDFKSLTSSLPLEIYCSFIFISSSSDMLVHIHEIILIIICNRVMHLLSFL